MANETFLRGTGWGDVLRRPKEFRFPAYAFALEHPDGLILIDTGMNARAWPAPGPVWRVVPKGTIAAKEEIGPAMRAQGLTPEDVRTVVVTHLDPDHIGGVGHFPGAEVLVHRREHEFAHTRGGRLRQRPQDWPAFRPALYDLDPEPYGAFPRSKAVRDDIHVVPLPGHSIGQVGVVVRAGDTRLFFTADHTMSQQWLLEDHAAGRLTNIGFAARKPYADTNRRIHEFLAESSTVLVPSHDPEVPARLETREPVPA